MNKELQKDYLVLPGGLGSVTIASTGQTHPITVLESKSDGSITLTFEAVKVPQIGNLTEDIPHEVVGGETKILTNGNENEVLNVGEWKKV